MNPLVAAKTTASLATRSFLISKLFPVFTALLCMAGGAFAATYKSVTLAWNANSETNIAGYRLRYGDSSGNYTVTLDAGNSLTATAGGLNSGSTYYFVVVAYNANGQTSTPSAEITYTVPGTPNNPPAATSFSLGVDEDSQAAATLAATDVDGDSLTYSIVNAPSKGTLTGTPPNLTYKPAANASGSDSFTYRVNDGVLNSATATVSITINPLNDTPLANSGSVTTNEDLKVAAPLSATDPDGNVLTYTIVSPPAKGTLTGTAPNLTYNPGPNLNGSDSFSFKVSDGILESAVATVSVAITPVNDPPVANAQTTATIEDTAVAISVSGSDTEGSSLTYAIVGSPPNGTLSGNLPNVVYTPKANFSGTDSFTYRVNDGAANSAAATVGITVSPVNDAPVATARTLSVVKNTPAAATISGTDADGNPLNYAVLTNPTHGALSGTPPNLTYTPATGYTGSDQFTFLVNDGTVDSAAATVSISVVAGNSAPVATPKTLVTNEDTNVAATLAGSDPDGNPITFSIVSVPTKGTFSGTVPNLTYRPNANANGSDSFTFRVSDGTLQSAVATVGITITPVNDTPVATARSISTVKNVTIAATLAGTDVDGNPLSYAIVTQPSNGSLSGTPPNVSYVPNNGYVGSDRFTFRVNDGVTNSNPANVDITVGPGVNGLPLAYMRYATTMKNKSAAVALGGIDPERLPISFRISKPPANGTLSGTPPNVIYTPTRGWSGYDTFNYVTNDGANDSAPALVTIKVKGKNIIPVAVSDAAKTAPGTAVTTVIRGSDGDGDNLTFVVKKKPLKGTLTGTPPNLVYTPAPGFRGKDRYTFFVRDDVNSSALATIEITVVNPNNRAPVGTSATVATNVNKPVAVQLKATDADGDPLTYRLLAKPASGKLAGKAPNFTYKPTKGFVGTVILTYVANDMAVDSAVTTVTINVVNATTAAARSIEAPEPAKAGGGILPLPVLTLQADPVRPGILLLHVSGTPGGSCMLETSGNLNSWSEDGEVTIGEGGTTTLEMSIPEGSKSGFYRLRTP